MTTNKRSFSLKLYILIVFAFSWPFQMIYVIFGDAFRPALLLSMIMAGVGTYVAGKYVFRDGFSNAGWSWGKPKHYIFSFGFALLLWLLPSIVEQVLGMHTPVSEVHWTRFVYMFLFSVCMTLIPAFGEEFSWRGYLLPRLRSRHSPRKALIFHGLVTWIWHFPVLFAMATALGGNVLVSFSVICLVSLIPTVMHAIVFAYIWSESRSLGVATFYHVAFDEVRDTIEDTVGLGPLGQNWQMLLLTIVGALILWKSALARKSKIDTC